MPNKNYFAQLSLKQKAELFNIYARGGYTSLSEIENHYNNLFYNGGKDEDNIVTSTSAEDVDEALNQYLEGKRQEIIQAAINKSYTRTMPRVPYGFKEDNKKMAEYLHGAANHYYNKSNDISAGWTYFNNPVYGFNDNYYNRFMNEKMRKRSDPEKKRIALRMMSKDLMDEAYLYATGKLKAPGKSCIGTATDDYGDKYVQYSNQLFSENPNGFRKIRISEIQPGDIVQEKDERGIPIHAMMFVGYDDDGYPKFNYSRGGENESSIIKNGWYTSRESFNDNQFNVYRFYGTDDDIKSWTDEYYNKKSYGGELNNYSQTSFKLPTLADYFSDNYKTHLDNPNMFKTGGYSNDNKSTIDKYITNNPSVNIYDTNMYDEWETYDKLIYELNRRRNDLGDGLSSLVFYYPDFNKPSTPRPVDYLPRMWEIEGNKKHELELFENGGDKKQYNIFEDKNSFDARDKHRKSLDEFIKNNPELYGISTSDFADFLSQIAGLESSYKSDAGKGMTYSGYYGLKGGRDLDSNAQHKAAFKHLKKLFNESIVKDDINKGVEFGYTPAQILAKYWNQGNRVTNYLWNNIDNTDGLGTKISDYGNNITVDMDYSNYLDDAITDDYIIINNSKSMSNAIKKARNPKMNYSNRENYILNLNGTKDKNGKTIPLDATKMHVGDTLWLKK